MRSAEWYPGTQHSLQMTLGNAFSRFYFMVGRFYLLSSGDENSK